MACSSDSKSDSEGCGCHGRQPFPWLSAISDPVIRRMFFQRYGRELLVGAGSGLLAGGAVLGLGEVLGGVGPLLNGPWLHLHAGLVLPSTLLGGVILALRSRPGAPWGWLLATAAVFGCGNACLEVGPSMTAIFQEGGLASVLAFPVLGVPAGWLFWTVAAKVCLGAVAHAEATPGKTHRCCSDPAELPLEAD